MADIQHPRFCFRQGDSTSIDYSGLRGKISEGVVNGSTQGEVGTLRTISVGTLVAAPGQKVKGRVAVLETPASTLTLPLVIVNGRDPGPCLFHFAGFHGLESPP